MTSLTKYQEQKYDLVLLNSMAEIAIKSGKYPGWDHASVMNVFLTATALDVHPMLALNSGFNIINGKINMGAHFMVSLARREGHSLKVLEYSKDKCIMLGTRKDNRDSVKFEYSWEDACDAGLAHKHNWKSNRKDMLYCGCARHLFRILFCDIAIPYDADEMNAGDQLEKAQQSSFEEIQAQPQRELIEAETITVPSDPLKALKVHLDVDGIETDKLPAYLQELAARKGKEVNEIVVSALTPQLLPKFKTLFLAYLDRSKQPVVESSQASA